MINFKWTKGIESLNFKKYKLILSSVILSSSLILSGCANASDKTESENVNNLDTPVETNAVENEDAIATEEDVENYFKDMQNSIINILESESAQNAKEDAIEIFITGVDFIFYGSEIKGYTFEELSTETKEDIIEIFINTDRKIEQHFPGYKDEISEEYNMGKDWLSEKVSLLSTITKEELGEETWNSLLETKIQISEAGSSLADSASKLYGKGKQKANEWYEGFKKEHE